MPNYMLVRKRPDQNPLSIECGSSEFSCPLGALERALEAKRLSHSASRGRTPQPIQTNFWASSERALQEVCSDLWPRVKEARCKDVIRQLELGEGFGQVLPHLLLAQEVRPTPFGPTSLSGPAQKWRSISATVSEPKVSTSQIKDIQNRTHLNI